jgi:hypothetical protein
VSSSSAKGKVLLAIEEELAARSRHMRIVYMNPVYDALLQASPSFRFIGRLPRSRPWLSSAGRYAVSLWQSAVG